MLVEKVWSELTSYGAVDTEYRGWFLFGLIPLYIKMVEM